MDFIEAYEAIVDTAEAVKCFRSDVADLDVGKGSHCGRGTDGDDKQVRAVGSRIDMESCLDESVGCHYS